MPGIGNKSLEKLLSSGITCREIYEMKPGDLKGILPQNKIMNIERSKNGWNFESESKKLKEAGIRFVPRIAQGFPEKLKNIPNAPFAIYVKGSLPDPDLPSVAIVGARMCSEYGRYMARQFGMGLALSGVQVISGMARGVDGIAQNAALSAGGSSYAVLGCGVDVCYPPENKNIYDSLVTNGGLISEYPPGTQPIANYFPIRNRIISALSDALVVVEARLKSGTQITVDTALEQGREVFAIPGRVTDRLSDGCNFLLREGADIALSVEDVVERLMEIKGAQKMGEDSAYIQGTDDREDAFLGDDDEFLPAGTAPEPTIEDEILGIVDIIPVSTSFILEELYKKGRDITVPELLTKLMDMTGSGKIIQNGAYYRKTA